MELPKIGANQGVSQQSTEDPKTSATNAINGALLLTNGRKLNDQYIMALSNLNIKSRDLGDNRILDEGKQLLVDYYKDHSTPPGLEPPSYTDEELANLAQKIYDEIDANEGSTEQ